MFLFPRGREHRKPAHGFLQTPPDAFSSPDPVMCPYCAALTHLNCGHQRMMLKSVTLSSKPPSAWVIQEGRGQKISERTKGP